MSQSCRDRQRFFFLGLLEPIGGFQYFKHNFDMSGSTDVAKTSKPVGTGSNYIFREDVEKLFDEFWKALQEDPMDLRPVDRPGLSKQDARDCLIDQLVEDLKNVWQKTKKKNGRTSSSV